MLRMKGLILLCLVACQTKDGVKGENSPPTISILSSNTENSELEGRAFTLTAEALDQDDNLESLEVAWYKGSDVLCNWSALSELGESSCELILESDARVLVEARDPHGEIGQADVFITVDSNHAPNIELLEPDSDEIYYSDQLVLIELIVSDNEDNSEDLSLSLSSSLDGPLELDWAISPEGVGQSDSFFSIGDHLLTIAVTDTLGKVSTQSMSLLVGPPNISPDCEIVSPTDDSFFVFGDLITLTAVVGDAELRSDLLEIKWDSDQDGELGTTQASITGNASIELAALSANTHTLTLTAQDEQQAECTDSIKIQVGEYPSILWFSPNTQSVHNEGETVILNVEIDDPEDQNETLLVSWSSNLDGQLGSAIGEADGQASLQVDSLSVGLHSLVAEVTDSDGLKATSNSSLFINGAPSAPLVTLTNPVFTTDILEATVSGSIDPEGETVTYTYSWYLDGVLTTHVGQEVLAVETEKNETWTLIVTPSDGNQSGDSTTLSQTILNSPPIVNSVMLSPVMIGLGDTITCSANGSDFDNEALSASYVWTNQSTGAVLGAVDSLSLDGQSIQPNDRLLCVVTITDQDGAQDSGSGSVIVSNTAPSLSNLSISPLSPTVMEIVTCTGDVSDPDTQSYSTTAEWYVGGSWVGSGLSLDLASVLISKGDTLGCDLMVRDDAGGTDSKSVTTTVVNSPPEYSSLGIQPVSPTMTDTIYCDFDVTDPDNDVLSVSYRWFDDAGQTLGQTDSLGLSQGSLSPGALISCEAIATDPEGLSILEVTSEIIANTAPSVTNIQIDPLPQIGNLLGCMADIEDPDNQALTVSYLWFNQTTGQSLGHSAAILLSSSMASRGDELLCEVTVVDPFGASNTGSDSALIQNSLPQVSQLQITPTAPAKNDQLICSASFFDPDGDPIVPLYEWYDSSDVQLTVDSELDLSAIGAIPGDTFRCTVLANDGVGGESSQSLSTTVINAAPEISELSFDPTHPQTEDVLSVNAVATDIEGEAIQLSYEWLVDGVTVTETTSSLSGVQYFDKNQDVSVLVTPDDGLSQGQVEIINVTVLNTVPSGHTLRFNTETPRHHSQDLVCELSSPAIDPDGDLIDYIFQWYTNGNPSQVVPTTTFRFNDTIPAQFLSGGDNWSCEVSPQDDESVGAPEIVETMVHPPFIDLAVGQSYSCGLDSAGDVSCWGSGDALSVPDGPFVEIESGQNHLCGQLEDGSLICWGDDQSGSTNAPMEAFDDFTMGYNMTCGLLLDSSLSCWGNTNDGRSTPPLGNFECIDGGFSNTCAILQFSGQTECWGEDDYSKSTPPLTPFVDLSVGYNTACGLTALGNIECWGRNHTGQFNVPSQVWEWVTVADTHVCGINDTSTAFCWGDNSLGQSSPPTDDFLQLESAVFHTCGLTEDGRIVCWGDNSNGQLLEP